MNKSDSIVEISKALAKFQAKVKQPLKDADNPFFKSKYVPLESVVEAITNEAPNHGLSFVQWALNDEQGRVGVATMLMHESGEFIEFDPVFMNAEKNTPQGAGSLITYLKRYSLSAVFGITSDQDDDANESSGNNNKPKQQADPLTEKLTVTFSQAMQKLGSANNVYKALNTNQTNMKKLFGSNNKKQKEETLKQLEGLIA
jgi:hypothetical protein